MVKGWKSESVRHSLSAKGIKTGRKKKKYDFYEDSGHGWLKVKKKELKRLGISNKISGFSYMRGDYAYLEEDDDLSTFYKAKVSKGEKPAPANVHITDKKSKIRGYYSYSL